ISPARLFRIPLRRWKLSLVCLLISAAVAFLAGLLFSKKAWHTEGTLVYSPLDIPEVLKKDGILGVQSAQTLMDRAKSQEIFEELRGEFGLGIPPEVLGLLFQMPPPTVADSNVLVVSLDWEDGEQGAALLNRFMEIHSKRLAADRKRRLDGVMATQDRE